VDRDFTASGPDELWVADITYVPTREDYLYLAVVIDAYSRKVVGWEMAGYLRSELVLEVLNMAARQREPEETVHHSDQGSQCTRAHSVPGLTVYSNRLRRAASESGGRPKGCVPQWVREATAATTRCASLSS
jgi:transposase InsO family protein